LSAYSTFPINGISHLLEKPLIVKTLPSKTPAAIPGADATPLRASNLSDGSRISSTALLGTTVDLTTGESSLT